MPNSGAAADPGGSVSLTARWPGGAGRWAWRSVARRVAVLSREPGDGHPARAV